MGVNGWLILLAAPQSSSGLRNPSLRCSALLILVFWGAGGGALLGFWEPPPPFWGGVGAIYLSMEWHRRESQVYGHCELGVLKPLLLGLLLEI